MINKYMRGSLRVSIPPAGVGFYTKPGSVKYLYEVGRPAIRSSVFGVRHTAIRSTAFGVGHRLCEVGHWERDYAE